MSVHSLYYISPNFTYEKLNPPFYKDLVDVFEDRTRYWLLEPAKSLLKTRHGAVAAVALATNYIEGIEIYITGKDSKRLSKAFFRAGFRRIFSTVNGPAHMLDPVTDALYEMLRCGFAHEGMFRNGIVFSTSRQDAVTVTWPMKSGEFDTTGRIETASINPHRFVKCIELHFDEYLRKLRSKDPGQAKECFLAAVDLKWQLNERDRVIAMTEERFHTGA